MNPLFMKAAAALVAAGAAGTAGQAALTGSGASQQSGGQVTVRVYLARPGDTLGKIAGEFCNNPADYPALARASGISNPNIIYVNERIVLACGSSSSSSSSSSSAPAKTTAITGSSYAAGSAIIPGAFNVYSYSGLERIWIAAGGSSATASHAACIAEHESGGRQWVISPTSDYGLWQIHNGGYAMLDAFANAARAVAMSNDGTNWGQWTTAGDC